MDNNRIIVKVLLILGVGLVMGLLSRPDIRSMLPVIGPKMIPSQKDIAAFTLSQAEEELVKTAGIDRKVLQLAKLYGEGVKRLEGYDEKGSPTLLDGLSVDVPYETALSTLNELRQELAPLGYEAYRYETHFGMMLPDRLAVIKAGDKFDIVRFMGTDGANYDIDNKMVIDKLKDWDSRFGLELVGVGGDFVDAKFTNLPPDMTEFAREVSEFCPDAVDQGADSVEALAKEMKRNNAVCLWWD